MTVIIIIGTGTAGLTVAIYGTRAGLSVKIIEHYTSRRLDQEHKDGGIYAQY